MIDFESIRKSKADKLREIADNLIKLSPRDNITLNLHASRIKPDIPPDDIIRKLAEWEESQNSIFLYYFALKENTDLAVVHNRITAAKKNKIGGRAYPRINSVSRVLYVGSSKEITKRFREHLGYGYKGTYAMNLAYWFSDLDTYIDFFCMSCDPNINKDVIQAFEDGLWDNFKPLLGRQGAR